MTAENKQQPAPASDDASASRATARALVRRAAEQTLARQYVKALQTVEQLEKVKDASAMMGRPLRTMIEAIRDWQGTAPTAEQTITKNRPLWIFPGGAGSYLPTELCRLYMQSQGQNSIFPPSVDIEKATSRDEFNTRIKMFRYMMEGIRSEYQPSKVIIVGGSRFGMLAAIVAGLMKADNCVLLSPVTSVNDPSFGELGWRKGKQFAERFKRLMPEGYRDMKEMARAWKPGMRLDVIYSSRSDFDNQRIELLKSLPNVHFHPDKKWLWHDTFLLFFTSNLIGELTGTRTTTAAKATKPAKPAPQPAKQPVAQPVTQTA